MFFIQSKHLRPMLETKRFSREHGQSIVIVTMAFVGLVAMLGLVIDGGNAYLQRRRAQNAADGASFAGAIELARPKPAGENPAQTDARILNKINSFATSNGITNPSSNLVAKYIDSNGTPGTQVGLGNVPGNAKGVMVTPAIPFNTFFLGVVGQSSGAVNATAKASFAPISSPDSLQPLATKCDQPKLENCGFTYGTPTNIWDSDTPGNFGWLSWNGNNSADTLRDELIPGAPINYIAPNGHPCSTPTISIGCWVQGSPGVEASAQANLQNYWLNTGDTMIVPIWDSNEDNGSNSNYHIVGFAAFIVTDFRLTGHGYITGKFIKWVTAGDLCTGPCFDSGLNGVHLRP